MSVEAFSLIIRAITCGTILGVAWMVLLGIKYGLSLGSAICEVGEIVGEHVTQPLTGLERERIVNRVRRLATIEAAHGLHDHRVGGGA